MTTTREAVERYSVLPGQLWEPAEALAMFAEPCVPVVRASDYDALAAEVEGLRRAQQWQPMSTVPRDRYVLLLTDEPDWAGNVECGKWFGDGNGEFWSAGGPNGGLEVGGLGDFIAWMEAPAAPSEEA